jgi:hypothetical protein
MRSSTLLFAGAGILIAVGLVSMKYIAGVQREFSGKTTIAMGKVVDNGAVLRSSRRSNSEYFCWVEYEFTPSGGAALKNWRFWEPACGVSPGRPIPVQYVVANPALNRPAGSAPSFPSWFFLFAAGVAVVVAFIRRGAEESPGDDN